MKRNIVLLLFLTLSLRVSADEGMWLPGLIGDRIPAMRSQGFRLTADDVYSVNRASLKDAVVRFGRGCTGNLVSDRGLLLTNHHCGYGQIQAHSSVDRDYLTDGFWAMSPAEELPNPGLTVSVLVRMDDVTDRVLGGVTDAMPDSVRAATIARNVKAVIAAATEGTDYEATVEPFYYGNQYFLFVSEVYRDVRLVAAPPSAVGKFGGDTDNWMWPRHTGDFSVFRVYAGKDNRPADYSPDNVPYRPRRYFEVSARGVNEGDFTWVYGYPGRTSEYLLSDAVDYIARVGNPHKIALRTERLRIIGEGQAADVRTRIQYASKAASVANAWKKWQGEARGVDRLGTVGRKRALEQEFMRWAADKPAYRDLVDRLHCLYDTLQPYAFARDYWAEAFGAIELTKFASDLSAAGEEKRPALAAKFYKDYSPAIDRRVAAEMLARYLNTQPGRFVPEGFAAEVEAAGGPAAYADSLFARSALVAGECLADMAPDSLAAVLRRDPATMLARRFNRLYATAIYPECRRIEREITRLYRLYMRGLMEMQPGRAFYPDANSTLRVSYGRVAGYRPADGIRYLPVTTLCGVIEKDDPAIYDYDVPERLHELYTARDFGRWAEGGTVPVAFIATNHTSGGNSGSPVLDGRGRLVGLNFDRTWESTMSDVEYDPEICRNIAVDIRYVLFLIEKLGGAGYLLDEMRIVD